MEWLKKNICGENNKAILFGMNSVTWNQLQEIKERYVIVGGCDIENGCDIEGIKKIDYHDLNKYAYDYMIVMGDSPYENYRFLKSMNISDVNIKLAVLEFLSCKNVYNGQGREDEKLMHIFRLLGYEDDDITYLELGTNDPIVYNNTFYFYKHGSRGVLVEPNPELHEYIRFVRKNDRLLGNAVDVITGKNIELFITKANAIATTCPEKTDAAFRNNYDDFYIEKSFMVDSISINDIFKSMDKVPELLCIDIEGKDLTVLKTMDFSRYKPLIIVAELLAWGAKVQEGDQIVRLLQDNGYELSIFSSELNGIFLRADIAAFINEQSLQFFKACNKFFVWN